MSDSLSRADDACAGINQQWKTAAAELTTGPWVDDVYQIQLQVTVMAAIACYVSRPNTVHENHCPLDLYGLMLLSIDLPHYTLH